MIKSLRVERDRKERDRLRANRLEMDKREEAERERIQHSTIMDRNRRMMDKGIDAVKRKRGKTYFS